MAEPRTSPRREIAVEEPGTRGRAPRRRGAGLALALALLALPALAQPAFRVADLNTTSAGDTTSAGYAAPFAAVGEVVYFGVDDGIHGTELWASDGTAAGTHLVADVCPGACSSYPLSLTAVGSTLYFVADDGAHGWELWRTDGTAAGTGMMADILPGLASSFPDDLTALGGRLVFRVDDRVHGLEPWVSDGTAAGTRLLADVRPGAQSSIPRSLLAAGGNVFFSADDGVHGHELWKTDGTPAGTALVKDIVPGPDDSIPYQLFQPPLPFAALGGEVYFYALGASAGLWASDGTAGGTRLVAAGLAAEELVAAGPRLFAVAVGPGAESEELWTSDGTTAGTVRLASFAAIELSRPKELTAVGGRLFFTAAGADRELWTSDGTAAGTREVTDIYPGGRTFRYDLHHFTALGGRLVFFADDGVHGSEPWTSDGTAAGTALLADLNPGPDGSLDDPAHVAQYDQTATAGGRLFFRAYSAAAGLRVYVSDGSPAGTHVLAPIDTQTSAFRPLGNGKLPGPKPMADLAGTLLFAAGDGTTGAELARSDGTAAGTRVVQDIAPGTAGSLPLGFTALGGEMLFSADDGVHGRELWATDGTGAGTRLAADLGLTHGIPVDRVLPEDEGSQFVAAGGRVLIPLLNDGLWASDGTAAGTVDLTSGLTTATVYEVAALGDRAFFAADQGIWATDGTPAGTRAVELPFGVQAVKRVAAAGGRVFFEASDLDGHGREPWVTDGTAAGTHLVKDIRPGGDSLAYEYAPRVEGTDFAAAGGRLFFAADDGAAGAELWVSDGTATGTHLVKDIFPGPRSSEIRWLTAVGPRVFFVADDGVHGRELWVSDGTAAGTALVADLMPGGESSVPQELAAVDGRLLFSATNGVSGREPWVSDGTAAGTFQIQDIAPGALSSSPLTFTVSGQYVFFAADDNATGFELWALPRASLTGPPPQHRLPTHGAGPRRPPRGRPAPRG